MKRLSIYLLILFTFGLTTCGDLTNRVVTDPPPLNENENIPVDGPPINPPIVDENPAINGSIDCYKPVISMPLQRLAGKAGVPVATGVVSQILGSQSPVYQGGNQPTFDVGQPTDMTVPHIPGIATGGVEINDEVDGNIDPGINTPSGTIATGDHTLNSGDITNLRDAVGDNAGAGVLPNIETVDPMIACIATISGNFSEYTRETIGGSTFLHNAGNLSDYDVNVRHFLISDCSVILLKKPEPACFTW